MASPRAKLYRSHTELIAPRRRTQATTSGFYGLSLPWLTDDARSTGECGSKKPFPSGIVNHRHHLAIDLHLLPYCGQPSEAEAPYIYRSQASGGTTSFCACATVYVIPAHRRVTLAIRRVRRGETAAAIITRLREAMPP